MPLPFSRAQIGLVAALAFALFSPVKAHAGEPGDVQSSIGRGNAAFDAGDFPTAAREYELAVKAGARSPSLFLHLGNAHYRAASEGEAALWWRRAQITDPLMAEAFQNHRFVASKTGLLAFKSDTANWVAALLPLPVWLSIGISGCWAFVIGFVALTLHPPRRAWRSLARTFCWLGFLIGLIGFAGFFLKTYRDIPNIADLAIVVTADTTAKAEATDDGGTVIELPRGSEVVLLGERGPWTYIGIPGDLRGWVRTGAVEKLWPYDPSYLR